MADYYPLPVQTVSVADRTRAHAAYRVAGDEARPNLQPPGPPAGSIGDDPTGHYVGTTPWARDGYAGPPQA